MDVEDDLGLGKLSLNVKPSSIPSNWTRETAERAFQRYQTFKEKEDFLKSVMPNRLSIVKSHNPLIRIEYLDVGYKGAKTNVNKKEHVALTDYVCTFDAFAYVKFFGKKNYALPCSSIIKIDARLFQTLMYVNVPNEVKTVTERYYEYVLNLMTLPMPVPVSPFYLLMTRTEYSKLYTSSSESICSLKRLYSIRALNCDTKIKTSAQLKVVNDDMVRLLGEEDVQYGNILSNLTERYRELVERLDLSIALEFPDREFNDDAYAKCEYVLAMQMPVLEAICYEMVEAMYFHLIRVVNVIECACINLYVHDSNKDATLNNLAEIEGKNNAVTNKWSFLTTSNCLLSTKDLLFSRDSIKFRRNTFFDATSGRGYMFGKEGKKDWNAMCVAQCNYVDSLLREHVKIPGFKDKHDACCANVAYQYFSSRCYKYMASYEEGQANDQTKLDVFCASSFACVQFLNVYLAKKLLDEVKIDETDVQITS